MSELLKARRYRVEGMDCAGCAMKIDSAIRKLPGISDVNVSATAGTMSVRYEREDALAGVEKTVKGLGYRAFPRDAVHSAAISAREPVHDRDHHAHEQEHEGHDCSSHDHARHDHAHDHHTQDRVSLEHAGNEHHHQSREKEIAGLHGHDHGSSDGPWWRSRKTLLTAASGAAVALAYVVGHLLPEINKYAFIVAMLVGLVPIAQRAVMAALAGIPFTIETLMTIAAVGAVLINASEEAATVVFLFLVGELLEGIAAGRARAGIQSLSKLVPKTAFLEENGKPREVEAASLGVGAVILIRPGDRIPADGIVVDGESAINEAPVTGESMPVRKRLKAVVYAGTINGEAALRIRVTAAATDNTIARVVKLVEEAQESKSPTERFIDRFSRYYTPGVLITGALIALVPPLLIGGHWSEWIYKGLAVLLIGCPCALVISTPAAIAASLSAGARRGLLMKGGTVLEGLGKINIVALDKTGTLTEGKPKVTDVINISRPEVDILKLAASIEIGSSHPLAIAILERAAGDMLDVSPALEAKALGGKGVTGIVNGESLFLGSPQAAGERASLSSDLKDQIRVLNQESKTVSVLLAGETVVGAIAMRDEPRPDAKAGIQALKEVGVKTVMLTGDNASTAKAIAMQLGIDDVRAELMPEDKQRIVTEFQKQGFKVAKIGDGINDAPALAAADVGIAMGGGTDVALETADAAILHGRVGDIAAMISLSQRTMSNIKQNITAALGLKVVFLVTTIAGITGLWPAILADTGATVLVTINALRLLSPAKSG